MAAISTALGPLISKPLRQCNDEEMDISKLPDPRRGGVTPLEQNVPTPTPSRHPDLSNEITTLSTKLINAIDYQATLDDTLSATRHDLEAAREKIAELEQRRFEHATSIENEELVKQSVLKEETSKLMSSLAQEQQRRKALEREKKDIEQELENLTTALFEEANKMVITSREEARKEQDVILRKNELLKAQLLDTESLLKSHQEQLAELKQVMEHLTESHDEHSNLTAPSTPGMSKFEMHDIAHEVELPPSAAALEPPSPSHPTSFTYLIQPVLRTDLAAYDEFIALLHMSKNVVNNRVSSGSYGNIGLGLGLTGYVSSSQETTPNHAALPSGSFGSTPATPVTPASSVSTSSASGPNSLTPLKETKFYKRALVEDIEPTLRLDHAPGLSWLARRTVLNSVCEGSLVVEPIPTNTKPYNFPCSLCGDDREDPNHVRKHRFRTSESDSAQRYPLCRYCLGRVRSTCDFLSFLRVLKDGHWRADDEDAEKSAWEESVRLREHMFWRRMGGGVIPSGSLRDTIRSPRLEDTKRVEQERRLSEEFKMTGEIKPRDITPITNAPTDALRDAAATGLTVDGTTEGTEAPTVDTMLETSEEVHDPENNQVDELENQRESAAPLEDNGTGQGESLKGLAITIPDCSQ